MPYVENNSKLIIDLQDVKLSNSYIAESFLRLNTKAKGMKGEDC